VPCD
jgi:hypothetical protein